MLVLVIVSGSSVGEAVSFPIVECFLLDDYDYDYDYEHEHEHE
jgi:hypothetical protein